MTGYLYILKHGIGPGTMPSDVTILKEKDLPNYYTAVWLDRFLTTSELRQYDIPSETRINELLDRIDYCQADNGDDVVPCSEINACENVMASEENESGSNLYADRKTIAHLLYEEIEDALSSKFPGDDYYLAGSIVDKDTIGFQGYSDEKTALYAPIIKEVLKRYKIDAKIHSNKHIGKYISFRLWDISNESEKLLTDLLKGDSDVDACDNITASKIIASKMSDIDLLANEALECTTKDELGDVISGLDSLGLRKLYLHYMEMLRDDSLSVGYIASDLSDTLYNMFSDNVEACDKVTAAIQLPIDPKDTIYDLYQIAVTWCDDSEVDQILLNNGTSPDSRFIVDENTNVTQAYNDLIDYIKNNINPDILNEREYALVYGDDVEACDTVDASDTKYFADMVSCSSDPELDDDFLVEGYYDNQRRGLAESAETSDVSALNELINDYANQGYYIVVHNLTDGVITEFSADNWFNNIAPDGGAELFMSW